MDSWKERLPELLQRYARENIWNLNEMACFWRALPDHGFGKKGTQCKGGKKAKHRITVALIANAVGGHVKSTIYSGTSLRWTPLGN